ncbi:MAG: hypothetical protein BA863_00985 [Desulfovibrio sp. S3730MH75]|nr:MAG: hypothetical protein BA863_00985 [Desulfovibrio sp. S3730MH75]
MSANEQKIIWVGSSKKDLRNQPLEVVQAVGYSLHVAQQGGCPENSEAFGQGGSGVMEISVDCKTDTYRTMYVAKLTKGVYVLHSFQKKSKKGKSTPKAEIDKVKARYKEAVDYDMK